MGEINVSSHNLGRLLADSTGTPARSYQAAFSELAESHRSRSAAQVVVLLRRAADEALLGFTAADLVEQAEAIRTGQRYALRICVTLRPRPCRGRGLAGPSGRRSKGLRTGTALSAAPSRAPGRERHARAAPSSPEGAFSQ
ncbi:hypothetical protein [Streptomyces anulatus]|uniref:hypothetical protein n=1 Tax=Streptomyces anulatus TaxID=1892 RepID=UPI00386B2E20|nr:hypothetical protein OG536_38420 [Streptomyces anulatus]